jgi:hypothetical protein
MMKKRCLLFIVVLVLLCSVAAPVWAAQADMPLHISGSTYYDSVEKTFLYYANKTVSQAVRSNVADGMITEQAVTVQADAGVALEMYLNGARLDSISAGSFQTPGEYVVMYVGGTVPERLFSFTIVPKLSNSVNSYTLPKGFEILEATLNDEAVSFDKSYIRLTEEGQYNIKYRCIKTNVSYQLLITTDFTGPVLSLEGVQDGQARGPVDISEAKKAAYVSIYHDGEKISSKDVLTESGEYYIELADEAGNKTTYSFTILVYFDGSSWLFILLLIGSCVGLTIYLVRARKHLRVR